ncbi:MAG: putative dehydrogenase [Afipia broomeae]|jgi:predicted dehydrogenase
MMIVGLGALGQQYAALALSRGYRVVGVDMSAVARRIASDAFPDSRLFATVEEALDTGSVDGAVISTPHGAHFEAAKAILSRGVPVYVEKPAFETLEQFDTIAALARENAFFRVGTQYLYLPGLIRATDLLQADKGTGFLHLVDHCALSKPHDPVEWQRQVEQFVFDMAPHAISIVYRAFPRCGDVQAVPLTCSQGQLRGMALHFHDGDALIAKADYLVCSRLTVAGFSLSSDALRYSFDFKTGNEELRAGSGNPILDRLLPNLRAGWSLILSGFSQSFGLIFGRRSSYDQSFAALEEAFFEPPQGAIREREIAISRRINEATLALRGQLRTLAPAAEIGERSSTLNVTDPGRIIDALVTGANGFIGKACIERLVAQGRYPLAITRRSDSELETLAEAGHIALSTGDYGDLNTSLSSLSFVPRAPVHNYAAPVSGTFVQQVGRTWALLDAVLALVESRDLRLLHISSVSVVDFSSFLPGCSAASEAKAGRILRKGPYSYAKFLSEERVRARLEPDGYVIIRPGSVWREDRISSVLAILGRFGGRAIVAGSRRRILPAIHVDELLARIEALDLDAQAGQALNMVSAKPIRNAEFFRCHMASNWGEAFYFPRTLVAVLGVLTRIFGGQVTRFPDPIVQLANFTKSWSER